MSGVLSGDESREIVTAADPAALVELEQRYGATLAEVVDFLIEDSCWGEDFPHLRGHKGSLEERRRALIDAYDAAPPLEHYGEVDFEALTAEGAPDWDDENLN